MPDILLTASFVVLLSQFRSAFTAPSFDNFVVLVSGMVHAMGGHRVTDMLRAAGPAATKHFVSYYRFFSHGKWSLDSVGIVLLGLAMKLCDVDEIELVLDDTLCRRSGKKVALGSMHADPLLSRGRRTFHSYGHVYVVLAVHVASSSLAPTGWALPLLFRLFQGPTRGGRKDAASDQRRKRARRRQGLKPRRRVRLTDREVVDDQLRPCSPTPDTDSVPKGLRPKKTELAAEMILLLARRFPAVRFRVLADHLYNGKSVLHAVLSEVKNVSFITRGRPDAALYALPGPRKPGQRGRTRVKGDRLLSPEKWAEANTDAFQQVVVPMYGSDVPVLVASYLGMAYRSLPGRLLRYVIVKDPAGIYRTDYFISTDTSVSDAEVVAGYARRWPLEQTFADCKQKLGFQNTQVQLPASVRRQPPMTMLVYSLVVLWYLLHGHELAAKLRLEPDPWYAGNPRPSFTDMLACLRRASWADAILDPPLPTTVATEIPTVTAADRSARLASYLARVVATG
jgi:hypothetical protein